MQQSREVIDSIIKEKTGTSFSGRPDIFTDTGENETSFESNHRGVCLFCVPVVYGITTGFGKFARTVIPVHKLQ